MEYRDNLNLIDESELGYTNAAVVDSFTGFDNSPPYQPPYPSLVEGECFTPQPGKTPQQDDGYPPQSGNDPQHPGGYPPQPGGYGQLGNDQQGYPKEQYDQQQQTVIVTQPMGLSVVKGQCRTGNYLIPAIFACLCCCWPFGICAIHYATKANVLAAEGNLTEARIAAKNAFCMTITSVIIGLIFYGASMLYRHFSQQ